MNSNFSASAAKIDCNLSPVTLNIDRNLNTAALKICKIDSIAAIVTSMIVISSSEESALYD